MTGVVEPHFRISSLGQYGVVFKYQPWEEFQRGLINRTCAILHEKLERCILHAGKNNFGGSFLTRCDRADGRVETMRLNYPLSQYLPNLVNT